ASLAGPGALARTVPLSLGASLRLLAAVSLVNASLIAEFESGLPENAPSYFVLDIGKNDVDRFSAIVRDRVPEARLEHAPMLRGRIVSLKGVPADRIKASPDVSWVLNGDRGLTFAKTLPEASTLVEGKWWPENYEGPPLVSIEAEIAYGFGLQIGDMIAVNVLGRKLEAKIANLRTVDWDSLAINFVLVFSPNALEKAPYNRLATLTLPPEVSSDREGRLVQALAETFPSTTAIRVRDAIDAFRGIVAQVMLAVRAAGGLTLLVGAIVLGGALATSHRRRIRDAVIFKTLGATRRQIMAAHFTEYAVLAAVAGVAALGLGTLAAYLVVTLAMKSEFTFSLPAALQAVGLSALLVLAFGAAGTWRVLGVRPVPYLRGG
ncbi:MAG: ABC transporter permease, partial [Methyloligellaceae bacterium]